MRDYFTEGLQSKINMGNWAKMPQYTAPQPVQQNPALPPVPAGGGITGVADYNTMIPLAGGTPAGGASSPATQLPAGVQTRINQGGFLGAILRQFANKGIFG